MALTYSEPVKLGAPAPAFRLSGTDGLRHGLSDFRYARALVIVFMCNHCPYVQAVRERINQLAKDFRPRDVQVVGISSNDASRYPADGFEAMRTEAGDHGYVFPYLYDESQEVAHAYGAVCTPDFFVFENVKREEFREPDVTSEEVYLKGSFVLRYRGRLDDNWKDASAVRRRELAEALEAILAGCEPGPEQNPSMGCSIKWKSSK